MQYTELQLVFAYTELQELSIFPVYCLEQKKIIFVKKTQLKFNDNLEFLSIMDLKYNDIYIF